MWIDSHCHVTAEEFAEDRGAVIDRALGGEVSGFIAIGSGYGVAHNARAVDLAEQDPRIWASVGVHPHEAEELDDAGRAQLDALLSRPRVVAVGESGLILHFDGNTWKPMTSGVTQRLEAIWGSGPNDIYTVGSGTGGTILHYDGVAWKAETSPLTTHSFLHDVWGIGGQVFIFTVIKYK